MHINEALLQTETENGGEVVRLSIKPSAIDREFEVTISGPRLSFGGHLMPAQVNWSAYGSVSPDEAEAYGLLLVAAAARVQTLRGPIGHNE